VRSDSIRRDARVSLLVAAVVGGAVLAARTAAEASWSIAIAIGLLVALAALGARLWWDAPDRQQAKANLGTGLLVSVVVAGAVGGAQFAIDDRRRDAEHQREERANRAAAQQSLRLTVGREDLRNIDLSGEDLRKFYFAHKRLWYANLRKADLSLAVLNSADLRGADLDGADLTKAQLLDVTLIEARLHAAKLNEVVLRGDYAQLDRADLSGADLRGADLRAGTLDGANLEGARCDSATQWPRDFDPASAGALCR
jgi:uncharacterized protein YjbI with pentapeptide repeats